MEWTKSKHKTNIHSKHSGCSISVRRILHWSWDVQSDYHSKGANNTKRHHFYKYLLAVIIGVPLPTFAADVGGVSATANPVANSSGSVTNQAIQVLQGPYITNTYGDGIQCQGSTLNITPYATGALSQRHPFEHTYMDPVYNNSDNNDDGIPDNPGEILYHIPTRTGMTNNSTISLGVSATWSIPLDKKAQKICKEAAETQNQYRAQILANKRLDFEIARLKNCGTLLKEGIRFHPKSPYYSICADVVVDNVNTIKPHYHTIPSPSVSESRVSGSAADLGAPVEIRSVPASPVK